MEEIIACYRWSDCYGWDENAMVFLRNGYYLGMDNHTGLRQSVDMTAEVNPCELENGNRKK